MKLLNLAISTALIFNQALGFAEFKDGNNDLPIDGNTDSPDPDSSKQCYNPYGDNGMCNEWASYDDCNKNPGFMRTGCAEACGSCEDPCAHRLPTLGIWQEQVTQVFNAVYPEVFYNNSMYFTMEAIAPAYGEGWWEMDEYSQTNAARDYYLGAVGITPEVAATMSAEDLDIAVEQAIIGGYAQSEGITLDSSDTYSAYEQIKVHEACKAGFCDALGVADIDGYAVYEGIQVGVLYPTNEADNAIFYPAVAGDLDRESVYNALMRDDDLTLLFQVSDTYQFDPAVHGCTADHGCRWTYNGYGGYCTQD